MIVTYSGHGVSDDKGEFYLFPADIGKGDRRELTPELYAKAISSEVLSKWLRDVDAGEFLLVVDACQSAASVEGGGGFRPGPMGSRGLGQLAYDKGMRLLAASQAEQSAIESQLLKHGLLTYALLREGLEEGAADKAPVDHIITGEEWLTFGSERVPVLYQEIKNNPSVRGVEPHDLANIQHPVLFDFARLGYSTPIARTGN